MKTQPTQLNIICIVICILNIRKTENDAENILQNLFGQQKKNQSVLFDSIIFLFKFFFPSVRQERKQKMVKKGA